MPAPPLWEAAVDTLRRAIIIGDLRAGDRLGEALLAARLAVSRGPVRQALVGVEHEGLVRFFPRRGAAVLGFTDQDVHEIYDLRRVIEAHAARLAARDPEPAAIKSLRELVGEAVASAEPGRFRREVAITTWRCIDRW